MKGSRHQLFAGTALALNEHGGAARRGARDQIVERGHLGAAADNLVESMRTRAQPIAQLAVLEHETAPFDRVAENSQHLVVLEWLREVIEGAALGGGHCALDR